MDGMDADGACFVEENQIKINDTYRGSLFFEGHKLSGQHGSGVSSTRRIKLTP